MNTSNQTVFPKNFEFSPDVWKELALFGWKIEIRFFFNYESKPAEYSAVFVFTRENLLFSMESLDNHQLLEKLISYR